VRRQLKGVSMDFLSGGGDIFGSLVSAYSNHREAEMNRDWQENQRATAYQTTVKDLTAAGLSPMLAYSKGPTSGGSGATAAPMQPLKLGETEQRVTQSELQREQANVAKSTTEVNEASAQKLRAETANINQDTLNKGQPFTGLNEATIKELLARIPQHGSSAKKLEAGADQIRQAINIEKPKERFATEEPEKAKWLNPLRDALQTIFQGIGTISSARGINRTTTTQGPSGTTTTTTKGNR